MSSPARGRRPTRASGPPPEDAGLPLPDSLAQPLQRFIRHLSHERRLSAHTASNYQRDLESVARYCVSQGLAAWSDLDRLAGRAIPVDVVFTQGKSVLGLE